ncbi:MAG: lipopolysaccharide assembly protein LapA domain-containing protein [Actinomycetota bacterium]
MESGSGQSRDRSVAGGRIRTAQAIMIALLVVGLGTAIFVMQNTAPARVHFLVWSASLPLAAALLLAAVLGGILAFLVASLRARQLKRALRGHRIHQEPDITDSPPPLVPE